MQALPLTRASLLVRIQDSADAEAWRQFFELYAPVVYGFARKRGLQDADAADLMQDVLRSVSLAAGRLDYDPAKGTFRGWLYSVTRNKIFNFLDKQRRQTRGSGDSGAHRRLEELPAPAEEREEWDRDYERRRFAWAAERIREEFHDATWQAFWLTAVDGQSAKDAGAKLKMSPGAVYVAKSRVIARLREEIESLSEAV
jgi:RNA polymerase sigma factor (sigma-70 family)